MMHGQKNIKPNKLDILISENFPQAGRRCPLPKRLDSYGL